MDHRRRIYTSLEAELETKEMVVITGMRRVGKTTALNHLYGLVKSSNKVMLDLENPLHRKIFEEENYDAVWNNLEVFGIVRTIKAYIFIDEVQNLPELSRVVKYLYDHADVKFVLTGSSSYYLRNLFPESLAGRKMVFELFPLSFGEFLEFKGVKRVFWRAFRDKVNHKNRVGYEKLVAYYDEFMEFGGFPGVVLEKNRERKKALLLEIFTSYFEKDVKNLADFKDISKLRDLILLLIPRVGSKIEIVKLASNLGVSRETIYNYLAFLEQTYFVTLLPKYSTGADRQAAGSKKLFLCDAGMVNVLGRVSQGQLFEQSVCQNIRTVGKLTYYSKGEGSEIDFIVDACALEVKWTASLQDTANLERRGGSLKLKEKYVVVHEYSKHSRAILATDL